MAKKISLLFGLFVVIIAVKSCTYKSIEVDYANPCLDTAGAISHMEHIVPIIESRCSPCHTPQGADGDLTNLSTFAQLRFSHGIVGSVKHEPGFIEMPRNAPKIPDCEIRKIEKWANAGFPP